MYGTTKLSTQQATNMEWSIANCKIVSCNATRTDVGHKSTITGYLVMTTRGIRVRFRWKAEQVTHSESHQCRCRLSRIIYVYQK